MKITKFTILTLLLVSVLFSLLNGCGGDTEEEEEEEQPSTILTVDLEEELAIASAGRISDIKFHDTWMVVSNPFEIQIYHIHNNVYDNQNIKLRALLTGHQGTVETVVLSDDSEGLLSIAAGCSDGTIRIWKAGEVNQKINPDQSNQILIFTEENKEYYQDIEGKHSGGVKTLAFPSENKEFLVSRGGNDSTINLWSIGNSWDIKSGTSPDDDLPDPDGFAVSALTFSSDGTYFAGGNSDGKVRVWKPGIPVNTENFSIDEKKIVALVFLSDSRYLVSADSDSQIVLWDIDKGGADGQDTTREFVFSDPEAGDRKVTTLAFLSHSDLLAAGTDKNNIYFWKTTGTESKVKSSQPLQKHHSPITALASSVESTVLASGSEDGTIYISKEDEILELFEQ